MPVFLRRQLAAANFPSMLAFLPMGALRASVAAARAEFDVINTHFVVPTGPLGSSCAPDVTGSRTCYRCMAAISTIRASAARHIAIGGCGPRSVRLLLRADSVVGQSRRHARRASRAFTVSNARRSSFRSASSDRRPSMARHAHSLGIPRTHSSWSRSAAWWRAKRACSSWTLCRTAAAPSASADRRRRPGCRALRSGAGSEAWTSASISSGMSAMPTNTKLWPWQIFRVDQPARGIRPRVPRGHGLRITRDLLRPRRSDGLFCTSRETGHVVQLNDLADFTRALVELHDQPELRRRHWQAQSPACRGISSSTAAPSATRLCSQRPSAITASAVCGELTSGGRSCVA